MIATLIMFDWIVIAPAKAGGNPAQVSV